MAASASGGRDWYAALPLPWRTDSLDYVLRSIGAAALPLWRSAWGSTCNWIRRFPRRPLCCC